MQYKCVVNISQTLAVCVSLAQNNMRLRVEPYHKIVQLLFLLLFNIPFVSELVAAACMQCREVSQIF